MNRLRSTTRNRTYCCIIDVVVLVVWGTLHPISIYEAFGYDMYDMGGPLRGRAPRTSTPPIVIQEVLGSTPFLPMWRPLTAEAADTQIT